ncbi:MAG: ParB/RepB/Spo0J family partition protein [Pseudomonadota bacterium]
MSIKDRLARKTQDLVYPVKGDAVTSPNPMRTGPGQMLMVNSLMKESNEKLAVLEGRLKQFEGASRVLLLDADKICSSRWANRIAGSLESAEFDQLKGDIAESGGNVQPIKVRPMQGDAERYEIVFGHRRHRACVELKLPVLAMVEELSDAELFKQMDRENRSRADLSPWEQGTMYRQALQDKLFVSREQLARELGIDAGNLSKALRLAEIDAQVLKAFPSPLDLQYRWAKPLADALLHDRERLMKVLREFESNPPIGQSAKHIFDRLVGAVVPETRIEHVRVAKKIVAEIHVDGQKVSVKFAKNTVDESAIERLRVFIETELMGK